MSCWILDSQGCTGDITNITYVEGPNGAPVNKGGAICDACDTDQAQSVQYAYSQTTGFSFCITLGGGVSWSLPIGPNWEFTASTQLCYDNSETITVTADLSCAGRTKTSVVVWEIPKEVEVFMELQYGLWGLYITIPPYDDDCEQLPPEGYLVQLDCGTETAHSSYEMYTYHPDFGDESCPPPPGSCDKKALTVYNTIEYEVDANNLIQEHLVDEVIPCYYEDEF